MGKKLMLKKMNIRLQKELYDLIILHAKLEHLPPSSFVRKYLIENLIKDARNDEVEK